MVEIVSETIRVSKQTKEALLRFAARIQEETARRVDFDEAIMHLLSSHGERGDSFSSFVGSVAGVKSADLLNDLTGERRRDDNRAKRKHGV